ncbi:MAG: hypothetical protein ABIV07_13010, partial [Polaromonas sp.]
PRATMTRLALGQRRGIRDMVAVKTGFLLLAGPDDSPASQSAGWVLAWWDGKPAANGGVVQPRLLATLDLSGVKLRQCDKELKPEAMTVLEETPAAYKLLLLSDGMCDGGPLTFTVPRRHPGSSRQPGADQRFISHGKHHVVAIGQGAAAGNDLAAGVLADGLELPRAANQL